MAADLLKPTVFAAGYKGAAFVTGLLDAGIRLLRVVTYPQVGDISNSFSRLMELRRIHGFRVDEDRHPKIGEDRLVFLVGWQFLVRDGLDRCVVLHDSLLPQLRGFSPTITALLSGSTSIGITAIAPDQSLDGGPIYGSRIVKIDRNASLRVVFDLQTSAMVDLAIEILRSATNGALVARTQNQSTATYSLWRDDYDYFVDWRSSAMDILSHVQASGFPYGGAKGVLNGQMLTIEQASMGPDLQFVIRDPGKLWQIEDRRALVVCGSGMLWIDNACDEDGRPFYFKRLRARFLTPDTAWIAPFLNKRDS